MIYDQEIGCCHTIINIFIQDRPLLALHLESDIEIDYILKLIIESLNL